MLCKNFAFLWAPRQRAWFWKFVPKTNSHKVRIPVKFAQGILGRDREHVFFLNCHKSIFAQGVCYAKISHNRKCCAKLAETWFFLPCFALLSPWLHSSRFPTWILTQKTNSKHIRTALKSKIKIKTWKNTRKKLD